MCIHVEARAHPPVSFFRILPPCFFEIAFLADLGFVNKAELTSQPQVSCLCLSNIGIIHVCQLTRLVSGLGPGDLT